MDFLSLFLFPPPLDLLQLSGRKSGQIQSVVKSAAGLARDGAARRGLPLLQAHAGQRADADATHGDAAREEAIKKHG